MSLDRPYDENDLIARLKHGDQSGLAILMDHHGSDLMHYLVSILGRQELAEDVFQDTWVKVMGKIGSFHHEMSFAPWLFRIARNRAYDLLREEKRRQRVVTCKEGDEAPSLEIPTPEHFSDELLRKDTVQKILVGLDPLYREIVWLRFFQDKSYEEMAAFCRIPMGTVKSRLARALDQVAVLYSQLVEGRPCAR